MREALGLVETRGLANAILVADAMSKTANINVIGLENSKGLGYMTIKITGDVGAVNAAITCGKQISIENNSFVTSKVIPRPSNNIEVTFCKLENKKGDVMKENNPIEKNISKEDFAGSSDVIREDSVKEESEPSNNTINLAENIDEATVKAGETLAKIEKDKAKEVLMVEETSVKAEEESHRTNEVPTSSSSPEPKDSTAEKSKHKRSSKKKTDPTRNED